MAKKSILLVKLLLRVKTLSIDSLKQAWYNTDTHHEWGKTCTWTACSDLIGATESSFVSNEKIPT
ncbi:MAG: hypothetical protein G01um10145_383 [Microgenomates group bacterium Gr01-1014_5]|nr:MAG: hypothetical protein G01um10145_383 [Microgenomates group bacterium Gr01-1014_5]